MKSIIIICLISAISLHINAQNNSFINSHDKIFIYQRQDDLSVFIIEHLSIANDTVFRLSYDLKTNENLIALKKYLYKNHKEIELDKTITKQCIKDTLVYKNQKIIHFKNGMSFIDTSAPKLTKKNSNLNATLYLLNTNIKNNEIIYKFKHINIFSGDTQYSYKYLLGFWIVEYCFGNISYKFVAELKIANVSNTDKYKS